MLEPELSCEKLIDDSSTQGVNGQIVQVLERADLGELLLE
jgi:hypothetical protein